MKRARANRALPLAFAALVLGAGACGYEPVYGPESGVKLAVAPAPPGIEDPEALQAVLRGLRAELGRAGVLRGGEGYPRVIVEVTRVDEVGTGIIAQGDDPLSRGTGVAVTGRAWVQERRGAGAARDTGDVRRVERIAAADEPRRDTIRQQSALRAAGEALGRALARRILGEPEPAHDEL